MTLNFDDESGAYVGSRGRIDEWQFLEALQRCILAGERPDLALARLLEEETWIASPLPADELPSGDPWAPRSRRPRTHCRTAIVKRSV